jgi:hypothetical protein
MMETSKREREGTVGSESQDKQVKGRNYDQVTKDGTTSIGPLGAGSSSWGSGGNTRAVESNSKQSARTDDLLSDGSSMDNGDGFVGEEAGELQTGLAGSGSFSTGNAGSRQSDDDGKPDPGRANVKNR